MRVLLLHPFPGVVVEEVPLGQLLVHPIVDDVRRGIPSECVLREVGDLRYPAVPVPLQPFDEPRIQDLAPVDELQLLLRVADPGPVRIGSVSDEGHRIPVPVCLDEGVHPSEVPVHIVDVQDVDLPVGHVLHGGLDVGEPPDELVLHAFALGVAPVGVAAPGDVDVRQVLHGLPVARLDGVVHPGTVGPRRAPEHPDGCPASRLVDGQALLHALDDVLPEVRGQDVVLVRFVQ